MAQQKDNTRPLTPKQEKFCRNYVEIGNASEAYRLAYNCAKMKQSTVWECASKLLSNHKVATRIAELKEEYAEATRVDRAKVEKVLMGIVEVDPSDMYYIDEVTGRPRLKAPNQMPVHMRKALKKIKNSKGEVSYEFNGKTEAAKLLASMNGWEAPKKVEMGGNMAIEGKHVMDFSGLPEDDEPEQ